MPKKTKNHGGRPLLRCDTNEFKGCLCHKSVYSPWQKNVRCHLQVISAASLEIVRNELAQLKARLSWPLHHCQSGTEGDEYGLRNPIAPSNSTSFFLPIHDLTHQSLLPRGCPLGSSTERSPTNKRDRTEWVGTAGGMDRTWSYQSPLFNYRGHTAHF